MLGDFVWEDLNANGIQDPDELDNGINDVEVKLLADLDGDGQIDDLVATQLTTNDPDTGLPGWYKFNGLMPGVEYQVMFNNPDPDGPDAYMFSPRQVGADPAVDSDGPMSDVVVLASGEFNPTIDAGLFRKGSIHVFGFLDEDGDGIQDSNEDAFPDDPGKTFELLDANGDVIETQTTMAGMVWFEQLVPGTYTVRENPIPDGYALTTLPNERTFTIISGQELVYEDGAAMLPNGDQRFETNLGDELRWGNTELAMLGDFVWEDLNANGIQDPDELDNGINGVEVKLLADLDGDGQIDDVVATQLTTNDPDTGLPGWYKFNGLMPGVEYQVMFNNPDPDGPDAYMFSPRQVGADPAVDSDGPMSDVVVLASGEFNPTIDAGLFRKGSIHVFGFLDEDGDGIQDSNEDAFPDDPGKTFELLDANGDRIETQTTMAGMVWFEQLVPGTYTVRENPIPDGYALTTLPNERTFTIISGQELVYEDGAAMLPNGDQRFETNLGDELRWGNTELAMLGDFVWEDLNANGIQDPDELDNGINGVEVKLLADLDGDGQIDDLVATQLTTNDPDTGLPGWYKFNGLIPGVEYQVMFNNPDPDGPDAYMFSPRQVGADPAVDSDGPMSDVVVLASGEFNPTIDAGLFRKGSIHVFGFLDEDGDGIQDSNEDAFPDDPGKTFELLDANGDRIETQTTMAGMVWFEQLVPGTYTVRENPIPDGYALTTLPNERTFTIISGQELVYEDGAAMLPNGDQRFETNLGDELRWGNTELAMLGDFVWEDLNANGIQDPDELDNGINGVEVKLLADLDGDGQIDDLVATQLTTNDPDTGLPGWYKFNGLIPGVEYQVMFNNPDPDGPDAYMFSPRQVGADPAVDSDGPMSDVVVLASGEFNPTIDAGLFRKGSIHVFGFLDEDGDGIQDSNEDAFPDDPGKTFELLDANGDRIETQTTMAGMVWFEQLVPGTYTVRENPIPDGYALTTLPNERTFTIISGQELVYEDGAAMLPNGDQRFETNLGDELRWGNTELAMLGDFVWEDLNANGIQDPDELDNGINGVEVKLLADLDGDGQIDDVVATQLTTNDPDTGLPGWYKFNGLMPGVEYQVMFNNPDPDGPDAYMFSPRQVGADPAVDSDGPMSDVVVLASGEFNPTIDAGLFRKGSIHVFGFLDEDGDGIQDSNEDAFPDDPGKTFELLDANGDRIETQTTMAGMVWFEQLVPGTYTVRENPIPDGYALTTLPNERTFTIISGQELVYEDGAAMLPDGDQRFETNLGDELRWGNTELAMLGDFVWEDLNANGIQDPDELDNGINDVEVKLLADLDGDGQIDDVVATQLTTNDPDTGLPGWYKFNGLMPGVEYQVMFNNPDPDGPDAYMFSPRQVGADPAVDSDGPMSDVVVLASGEFNPTIDAGLFRKGSIHVFGFLDEDGDGIQDSNEGAFPDDPGKTFQLLDADGNVIAFDCTINGMVWFEQLVPGTYTVRENPIPDGYALTTLPNERTFTIISGQELVYEDGAAMLPDGDQRFETNLGDELRWGNTELAMLGDFVWEDLNANGIQDPDELDNGINDVEVKLLADLDGDGQIDDVVATQLTTNDPDTGLPGWYKFNGLMPGVEYQVMFNNPDPDGPDAYMFSPRQVGADPAVDSDGPMSDVVVLASGEFNPTIDAGLFRKGSIHVFGFLDENGNGIQDGNEGAFPDEDDNGNRLGKTFELFFDENNDGNFEASELFDTQTTIDGMVWFTDLTPGDYAVQENPIPDGYALTTLPNLREFTVMSGVELVYEDGAAMLPDGDNRVEMIPLDEEGDENGNLLRWGNTLVEPEIELQKFTRVDVNPIDIEKLVRVEGPGFVGDVCDVLGKPVAITFEYQPGTVVMTGQDSGKATATGTPDTDGESYIVGDDGDLFAGTVLVGAEFTLSGSFSSNTVIKIYDDQAAFNSGASPLQTIQYHTSCSQPIQLGDVIGSVILVGYVGENGASQPPNLGPGVGDDDADTPTGPAAGPGDTVVFTYVVTNPIPGTQLADVVVTDKVLSPVEGPEFAPDPVLDNGFNVGDTDMDNLLDAGEVWLYTSTTAITDATAPAVYVDKATVVAGSAMDMDPAHYVVASPPTSEDLCDVLGKAHTMTFNYTGQGDEVMTGQDAGKASATGDPMGASPVLIRVTDKSSSTDTSGRIYFQGNVNVGEDFAATATPGETSFKSQTYFYIFGAGTDGMLGTSDDILLQTATYHTSCSQPIQLGDVIGAVTLVGYEGVDGSAELPPPPAPPVDIDLGGVMLTTDDPFDPNNIGENADAPTGPVAQLGNKITWTYKVTNTGNVSLTITSLFDDNETPPLPPGSGDDDFEPAPVLKDNGNNFGDGNDNGLLDPNEMWYFQAMAIATVPGQHKNTAKVTAEDDAARMVMDDDMSNHIVNPLQFEKYVFVPPPIADGEDQCDVNGKAHTMTFTYTGEGDDVMTGQDAGKAAATGDPMGASPVLIRVTDKSSSTDTTGRIYFQGNVNVGEDFIATATPGETSFKSQTYFYIFGAGTDGMLGTGDDVLLQTATYHTSCSQPIQLGDVIGAVTLVGYEGEFGSATVSPGSDLGDPADSPTGPSVLLGDEVVFNFAVTNTGNVGLTNVAVFDSVLGAVTDFVDNGNGDAILDPGETWVLTASTIASSPGQQMNLGTVTATSVQDPTGEELTASDPAYHFVESLKFFVVDKSDRTFTYTDSGNSIGDTDLQNGNSDPRGAASDASGELLWVVDKDKHVYVYEADGTPIGAWEAKGIGGEAEGIAVHPDPNNAGLWIVDRDKKKVFYFSTGKTKTSGSLDLPSSFSLNLNDHIDTKNDHPKGITTDGTFLWVVDDDGGTEKVFKYTVGGTLLGSWEIANAALEEPRGITLDPVAALADDESTIWIVDKKTDTVFQFDDAADVTMGSLSGEVAFALAAENDEPEGIADPPSAQSWSASQVVTSVQVENGAIQVGSLDGLIRQRDKALARNVSPDKQVSVYGLRKSLLSEASKEGGDRGLDRSAGRRIDAGLLNFLDEADDIRERSYLKSDGGEGGAAVDELFASLGRLGVQRKAFRS